MNLRPLPQQLKTATYSEMAQIVHLLRHELKRRNPIFVNAYVQ